MNLEQNKQFEADLRKVRPVSAGKNLQKGIEAGLWKAGRIRRREKLRSAISWAGLAVAASLLITFGFLLFNGRLAIDDTSGETVSVESSGKELESEPDEFKPILAENNLQNRIDEGIVFLRNGLTARQYRYEFVDRVVWQNPVDGATVEMEIPRDEVVLVPVQTF